jgi:archaemetzincin
MAHFKTRRWLVAIVIIYLGCSAPSNRQVAPVIIDIQPFAGFSREMTNQVSNQIKEVYPHVIVLPELPLPPSAFYAPRNRFRADSIIKFLKDKTAKGHVSIGLTHKDISTTDGKVKDWGVMGLGYRPGNACVASTFRLNKEKVASQFYKVCVHELGHTSGLAHCTQPSCFMRDAEGGNPTDQEKAFCKSCSEFLSAKGWLLDKGRK